MPRAMWKGVISFGLVNIPVEMHAAIDRHEPSFHMLSSDGSCRLHRKLYCPETGQEYDYKDTAKGYEFAPDQYVLVDQEELDRLKPEGGRTIDITRFVDLKDIDPIYYQHSYYLSPGEHGAKAYALLAEAMRRSGRVGLARFIMRSNEYLAAVRVQEGRTMLLETMYYAEDIRSADTLGIPRDLPVDQKELKLAQQLIENLTDEFNPADFKNEYRERVEKLLAEKAEGKEIVLPESREREPGKVVDLMEMLKRSVEKEKRAVAGAQRRAAGVSGKKKGGKKRQPKAA